MSLARVHSVVIGVAFIAGCGGDTSSHMVGTLEWERVELVAEAAEPIVAIAVHEGDRVSKGQEILRLDARRTQAQVDQVRAARSQAAARLAELVRGTRAERILEASARLTGADQVLDVRKQELDRAQQLLTQKLASPDDVDKARAARDSAQASATRRARFSTSCKRAIPKNKSNKRAKPWCRPRRTSVRLKLIWSASRSAHPTMRAWTPCPTAWANAPPWVTSSRSCSKALIRMRGSTCPSRCARRCTLVTKYE